MSAVAASKKRCADNSVASCPKKVAKDTTCAGATATVPGTVTPVQLNQAGWTYPALPMGMPPYCFAANPFFNPFMFPPFWLPAALASGAAAASLPMMPGAGMAQAATAAQAAATNACFAQQAAMAAAAFPGCMPMFPGAAAVAGLMQQQHAVSMQQQHAVSGGAGLSSAQTQSVQPAATSAALQLPAAAALPAAPSMSGISCATAAAAASSCVSEYTPEPAAPVPGLAYMPITAPPYAVDTTPCAASPVSVCNGSSGCVLSSPDAEDQEFATFIDSFLKTGDLVDVSFAALPAEDDGVVDLHELDLVVGLVAEDDPAPACGLARSDSLLSLLGAEF